MGRQWEQILNRVNGVKSIALAKDGSNAATSNIDLGGHKIINLGNAVNPNEPPTLAQTEALASAAGIAGQLLGVIKNVSGTAKFYRDSNADGEPEELSSAAAGLYLVIDTSGVTLSGITGTAPANSIVKYTGSAWYLDSTSGSQGTFDPSASYADVGGSYQYRKYQLLVKNYAGHSLPNSDISGWSAGDIIAWDAAWDSSGGDDIGRFTIQSAQSVPQASATIYGIAKLWKGIKNVAGLIWVNLDTARGLSFTDNTDNSAFGINADTTFFGFNVGGALTFIKNFFSTEISRSSGNQAVIAGADLETALQNVYAIANNAVPSLTGQADANLYNGTTEKYLLIADLSGIEANREPSWAFTSVIYQPQPPILVRVVAQANNSNQDNGFTGVYQVDRGQGAGGTHQISTGSVIRMCNSWNQDEANPPIQLVLRKSTSAVHLYIQKTAAWKDATTRFRVEIFADGKWKGLTLSMTAVNHDHASVPTDVVIPESFFVKQSDLNDTSAPGTSGKTTVHFNRLYGTAHKDIMSALSKWYHVSQNLGSNLTWTSGAAVTANLTAISSPLPLSQKHVRVIVEGDELCEGTDFTVNTSTGVITLSRRGDDGTLGIPYDILTTWRIDVYYQGVS